MDVVPDTDSHKPKIGLQESCDMLVENVAPTVESPAEVPAQINTEAATGAGALTTKGSEETFNKFQENVAVEVTMQNSTEKPPRPCVGSAGKRKRTESPSDQVLYYYIYSKVPGNVIFYVSITNRAGCKIFRVASGSSIFCLYNSV